MSDLSAKDVQAGKVRLAVVRPNGYYLQHHESPSMTGQMSGSGAAPELLKALDEKKVPTFTFESRENAYDFVPLIPMISAYDTSHTPWSSISYVPPEIGMSMMSLGADKTSNFEPLKLPLALFSEKVQENMVKAAIANGKHHLLVEMAIRPSSDFHERPDQYFSEVISKILPQELKNLTTGLIGSLELVNKQLTEISSMPKPTDETKKMELFSQKLGMEKQRKLLLDHISRVNETVLIGKANDWTPKKMMEKAAEKIKFKNDGIKQLHQKREAAAQIDPSEVARYAMSQKMERLVDKIIQAMNMDFGLFR